MSATPSLGSGEMWGVVTTATGGYDRLVFKAVPMPEPEAGEVLIRVRAAGVNNTEINTRLGWYSSSVTQSTEETQATETRSDGGWNNATPFPFIQGTDCCGEIVEVGPAGAAERIGERVIVRACMRENGFGALDHVWMGSDFDGAFAQFVKVPDSEAFSVQCDWSDAELATIPCAYGTAENMVHRVEVKAGAKVVIPGASGGVGSALVQLVKRRGAEVIAITSPSKTQALRSLGADIVLNRGDDLIEALGAQSVDAVIDNVGGDDFPTMIKLLKRGGRYATSGAIAGPMVQLDMRDMYLKDITLIGCTGWDAPVFGNLVSYIERGEIRPLLAKTFPLDQIAEAQKMFQEKSHIGKFVLIPPQ